MKSNGGDLQWASLLSDPVLLCFLLTFVLPSHLLISLTRSVVLLPPPLSFLMSMFTPLHPPPQLPGCTSLNFNTLFYHHLFVILSSLFICHVLFSLLSSWRLTCYLSSSFSLSHLPPFLSGTCLSALIGPPCPPCYIISSRWCSIIKHRIMPQTFRHSECCHHMSDITSQYKYMEANWSSFALWSNHTEMVVFKQTLFAP